MRAKLFLCFNNNIIYGVDLTSVKYINRPIPRGLGCFPLYGGDSVVVDSLLIISHCMSGFCVLFLFITGCHF